MAGGASVSPGQSRLLILSSDVLGGGCWYNTPVLSLTHGWCTLTHAPALTNTPTGVHTRVKERSRSWFHGPREPGGGGDLSVSLGTAGVGGPPLPEQPPVPTPCAGKAGLQGSFPVL